MRIYLLFSHSRCEWVYEKNFRFDFIASSLEQKRIHSDTKSVRVWIKEVIKVWKYVKRFITSIITYAEPTSVSKREFQQRKLLTPFIVIFRFWTFLGYKQIICDKEKNYVIKQCWLNINGVSCSHLQRKTKSFQTKTFRIDLRLFIIKFFICLSA